MPTRSRISPRLVISQLAAAFQADWQTSSRLATYQLAKETFNLRHPAGGHNGSGEGVRMINLRLTDRCNLRCHTCGQWGDNGYLLHEPLSELKRREVPVAIYKRFVDQVVEAGWSPIWYVWGGEPMLYPGLIELLRYIKDRDMVVALVSNGTKVAASAAELIEVCKIIYLSVDGPNAAIHNTQRPGANGRYDSFADIDSALKTLHALKQERGLVYPYVVPLTCIARYNFDLLADIFELTSRYADAHVFYLTWWIDPQSADDHARDFSRRFGFEPRSQYGWIGTWKDFDHGAIFDAFAEIERRAASSGRPCLPMMMPRLASREEVKSYYSDHTQVFGYDQCVSIFMELQIDANGDVSLCRDYHDYSIGNIRSDDIRDLWNGEKAVQFRQSISREGIMPVCRRCCGLMGY
jgi:radical SAM protein with 4Fe4S-binding SPASM domain